MNEKGIFVSGSVFQPAKTRLNHNSIFLQVSSAIVMFIMRRLLIAMDGPRLTLICCLLWRHTFVYMCRKDHLLQSEIFFTNIAHESFFILIIERIKDTSTCINASIEKAVPS